MKTVEEVFTVNDVEKDLPPVVKTAFLALTQLWLSQPLPLAPEAHSE